MNHTIGNIVVLLIIVVEKDYWRLTMCDMRIIDMDTSYKLAPAGEYERGVVPNEKITFRPLLIFCSGESVAVRLGHFFAVSMPKDQQVNEDIYRKASFHQKNVYKS